MRIATAPHHTNPRSATLDFWRKTLIKVFIKLIENWVEICSLSLKVFLVHYLTMLDFFENYYISLQHVRRLTARI